MTSLQHNKALIPKIQNKQASSENQISWFFTLILQTYDVLLSTKYEHLFRVIIFKSTIFIHYYSSKEVKKISKDIVQDNLDLSVFGL